MVPRRSRGVVRACKIMQEDSGSPAGPSFHALLSVRQSDGMSIDVARRERGPSLAAFRDDGGCGLVGALPRPPSACCGFACGAVALARRHGEPRLYSGGRASDMRRGCRLPVRAKEKGIRRLGRDGAQGAWSVKLGLRRTPSRRVTHSSWRRLRQPPMYTSILDAGGGPSRAAAGRRVSGPRCRPPDDRGRVWDKIPSGNARAGSLLVLCASQHWDLPTVTRPLRARRTQDGSSLFYS